MCLSNSLAHFKKAEDRHPCPCYLLNSQKFFCNILILLVFLANQNIFRSRLGIYSNLLTLFLATKNEEPGTLNSQVILLIKKITGKTRAGSASLLRSVCLQAGSRAACKWLNCYMPKDQIKLHNRRCLLIITGIIPAVGRPVWKNMRSDEDENFLHKLTTGVMTK